MKYKKIFFSTKMSKVTVKFAPSISSLSLSPLQVLVQNQDIGFPYAQNPVPPPSSPQGKACILSNILDLQVTGTVNVINYGYAVEPQLAVNPCNPCNLIAIWQQNRTLYFGAQQPGVAYSFDGGQTWQRTVIPAQVCLGGITQTPDDVWVSFSSTGRAHVSFMINNINYNPNFFFQSGIGTVFSDDGGRTWSAITPVASSQQYSNDPNQDISTEFNSSGCVPCPLPSVTPYGFNPALSSPYDDKDMIYVNPNYPNIVYIAWHRYPTSSYSPYHSNSVLVISEDNGCNWSNIIQIYDPFPDLFVHNQSNGLYYNCYVADDILVALPVPKFCGDLLDFINRTYALPGATNDQFEGDGFPQQYTGNDLILVRSSDKGVTWTKNALVITNYPDAPLRAGGYTYDSTGKLTGVNGVHLRSGGTHKAVVDPTTGFLYLVYGTLGNNPTQLPAVFLRTSRDGGYTWSPPILASQTPLSSPNPQAFCPTVAVGSNGKIGILYHDTRYDTYQVNRPGYTNPASPGTFTAADAWFALFQDGNNGPQFVSEVRLTPTSYNLQRGGSTYSGKMVQGEYNGLVAVNNIFTALYITSVGSQTLPEQTFTNSSGSILVNDNGENSTSPHISVIKV